jgi:pimeloyl-ACP methyl ester carboxylesterase
VNRTLIVCACIVVSAAQIPAGAAPQHRDEDITFQSGATTLAGTVSLPSGGGPFPAVVLLSGSGPQNRDSEVFGFRPFKLIADHFVKRGIAVLRFDDRGVGGSTGSLADATMEDFADDALAAVRTLRARRDIDGERIGLLGHSEGATVAAAAAARGPEVAFIVWMAGNAVTGAEILRMQAADIPRGSGASRAAIDEILRRHDAWIAAVKEDASLETLTSLTRTLVAAQLGAIPRPAGAATGEAHPHTERLVAQGMTMLQTPWFRSFVRFDPATALRRVACPVFAAFGGRDVQIPEAVNRARLEAALQEAGNQQVTVRVYPEANHLFQPAITGQLSEYTTLPRGFVPSLLDDIAEWIAGRPERAEPAVKTYALNRRASVTTYHHES